MDRQTFVICHICASKQHGGTYQSDSGWDERTPEKPVI